MIITFHSIIINNQDKKQKIKFSSQVHISSKKNMTIYEFKEPSQNIMNCIEIGPKTVNIFAGPTTINLELKKTIQNEFITKQGNFWLQSYLYSLKIESNYVNFEYKLSQNKQKIANYNIQLIIKK